MKESFRLLAVALAGMVFGFILSVGYQCADAWYHGGSPDPRCVYGWRGYVEVHKLNQKRNSVLCQYRPEIFTP